MKTVFAKKRFWFFLILICLLDSGSLILSTFFTGMFWLGTVFRLASTILSLALPFIFCDTVWKTGISAALVLTIRALHWLIVAGSGIYGKVLAFFWSLDPVSGPGSGLILLVYFCCCLAFVLGWLLISVIDYVIEKGFVVEGEHPIRSIVIAVLYAAAGTGVFAATVFLSQLTGKALPIILLKIGAGVLLIGIHLLIELAAIKEAKQRIGFSLIVTASLIICNLISFVASVVLFLKWPSDWFAVILTWVAYSLVCLVTGIFYMVKTRKANKKQL